MIEQVYNCKDCNRIFSEHYENENFKTPRYCPLCQTVTDNIERIGDSRTKRQRNGLQSFYELLEEAASIHDRKSHDYANNADPLGNYRFSGEFARMFTDPTDAGLMGRFVEKLYRLKNLEGRIPVNETIEDTENDMVVILALFVANRRERRARTSKSV